MWLYKLLFYTFVIVCAYADQDVQLEISQGILKGLKTETVLHNKPYYSFKGIPYAKPNLGSDKFRAPEPADPWEGVYDATTHRSSCPLYCLIYKSYHGEEDCLYLNVYTPVLDKEANKAVMVWLHPGGWDNGLGDDVLFGPDFLIEHDVVIVTLNFRLGVLGFLNTGDENAPGNAGMKDQVMALKWVKDNIHFFGGCPNRVTIFGSSSGGASGFYHMLSPMSEGLFNAVIQQSGSVLNPWALTYNPREQAFMLGDVLGIQTDDTAELVQKLSEIPAKDIIEATGEVVKRQNILNGHMKPFAPTVEADLGQDVFLPADPWTLLKSGRIADVPVMSGFNANESVFYAQEFIYGIDELNTEPEKFVPIDLNITDAAAKREIGESLRNFYIGDKHVSKEDLNEYIALLDDILFGAGEMLSLDILKNRITTPIYQYLFTYESPFGFSKSIYGISDKSVHGDEMGYLFYSKIYKNLPEPGSSAEKMTNILTKLWTNFAKDGNPTSKMDEDITVNWEPLGNDDYCLILNEELKLEKNPMTDRHEYWKKLYKDVMP